MFNSYVKLPDLPEGMQMYAGLVDLVLGEPSDGHQIQSQASCSTLEEWPPSDQRPSKCFIFWFTAYKSSSIWNIPIISLSFPYHFHIISLEEPYEPWITWARHIHLWILHPAAPPAPSWQTLGLVCGQPGQETSDINWIVYMSVLLSWCIHKHNYMTHIYRYTWFHQHVYRSGQITIFHGSWVEFHFKVWN